MHPARQKRAEVSRALRQRMVRALATGGLGAGDRLPSTREMSRELGADPRLIAYAYRELAAEGLVELRPRSGIYVNGNAASARRSSEPSAAMIATMLTEATVSGHSGRGLVQALQRVVTSHAVRTCVIAPTSDQGIGIARELHEDFGLNATSLLPDRLKGDSIPDVVRRAQLFVGMHMTNALVESLAGRLRRPHVIIGMRSDLFDMEWSLWRGETVQIVVLDPRFRIKLQKFLSERSTGLGRVEVHLATENLACIADDAPTYVTQAARMHLGGLRVPGILIPPTRLLRDDCVHQLWQAVAELNACSAKPGAQNA